MTVATHAPPTQKFDESIDNLSRSTQSLLRTMRLDVVLLGSQQQESQSTLSKLEQDWEMLQKLLEQQRRKEEEEQDKNEEEETKNIKEEEHLEGVVVVDTIRDETQEQKAPLKPQSRRHSSSIEWSEEELHQGGENDPTNSTSNLKLSDFSNSDASNKSTERLDHSNFDWGTVCGDIGDMEEEDRKADQAAPLTLDVVLNTAKQNEMDDSNDDDLPPIKRIFGWGRGDKRDSKLSITSTPTTTESSSFFGRRRASVTKKLEGDDAASGITECTTNTNRSSLWQALFRRDGSNNTRGSEERIVEKNNVPPSSATTKEDLTEAISTMQVKLRGCDSAASSLHQLVSFQKRQITDLQHERNRLKVLSEFESLHNQSELKSLVTQVESARVERERKEFLLKEAEKCRSIFVDKEEKLKEELECIRMELFMLNMQLETDSRDSSTSL